MPWVGLQCVIVTLPGHTQLDKLPVIVVPLPHGAVGSSAICDCDVS